MPGAAMPANQSSPSAQNGAITATQTTARTRPDSSAPLARACGPPPEWPITANCPMPSASAMPATSSAADAMSRPGQRSRSAVSGPVIRHPADAKLGGSRKQRLGRRAGVRRAMVPENSKASVGIIFAGVVNMQRAPVAQIEIGLCHHLPEPNDRDLTPLAGDHDQMAWKRGRHNYLCQGCTTPRDAVEAAEHALDGSGVAGHHPPGADARPADDPADDHRDHRPGRHRREAEGSLPAEQNVAGARAAAAASA